MLDYLQLYPETIEQVKRYSEAQRCRLYEAMAAYAFTGEEPSWPDDAPEWFIWETLRQQVNRTMKKVKQNRENASGSSQPERSEAKPSESKPTRAKASQPERSEAKPSETHNQESDTDKEIIDNDNNARAWVTDSEIKVALDRDRQIEDAAKSAGLPISECVLITARDYARQYGLDNLIEAIKKTPLSAQKPSWAYVEGILKKNGVKANDGRRNRGDYPEEPRRGKYSFLFDGTEAV